MNIGENIKKIRMEKGLTRQKLAKALKVSDSTISRYENNKREPNIEMLNKIADVLNVTPYRLMSGESLFGDNSAFSEKIIELIYNNKAIKSSGTFDISDKTKKELDSILIDSFLDFTTCIGLNYFKELPRKNILNIVNSKTLTDLLMNLLEIERINLLIDSKKVTEFPNKEKQIWEEPGKEHLMPIACHDDNVTDEEKSIVNDKINDILNNLEK